MRKLRLFVSLSCLSGAPCLLVFLTRMKEFFEELAEGKAAKPKPGAKKK